MPNLSANRAGFITGTSQTSYLDALSATSGTATDSATGNQSSCIQYFKSSGRGGGTFRFIRTFIHFDTSGISGGSDFLLKVVSVAGDSSDNLHKVTVVKSSAGSNNGSQIVDNDFDNVDKNTNYSAATAFGSSGTITFTLNSTAASQIISENNFTVALLLSLDVAGEEEDPLESDGDVTNGIAFSDAITLSYTAAAASGYTHKVLGVASANIGKVNGVATANIGKIITVD